MTLEKEIKDTSARYDIVYYIMAMDNFVSITVTVNTKKFKDLKYQSLDS